MPEFSEQFNAAAPELKAPKRTIWPNNPLFNSQKQVDLR
jgi:hypothetical protein